MKQGRGYIDFLSFLVESRGIDIGRENFARRVAAQVATHETIIDTTVKHAAEIKRLVSKEKLKLIQNGAKVSDKDQVVINSEFAGPFKDTLKVAEGGDSYETSSKTIYKR